MFLRNWYITIPTFPHDDLPLYRQKEEYVINKIPDYDIFTKVGGKEKKH